jgi:hypothetical protein
MAQTLKFGNKTWATKVGSTLAYNDLSGNYKPLPFNFTRSTSATRVNKEGLIELVTNDRPRIDYTDTSDGVLLLEKAATNLTIYSNKSSEWTKTNWVTTDNYAISPDGTQNAFRAVSSNNSGFLYIGSNGSSGTNTLSVYVKSNTNTNQKFRFFANGATLFSDDFTATSEWTRVQFSYTFSAITAGLYSATNELSDILFFGFQHEVNSVASSYIPTQGSASTRVAETATDSGNSEVFSDSQGVLFANISGLDSNSTAKAITINQSSTNILGFYYYQSRIDAYVKVGTNQFFKTHYLDPTANVKISLKYKQNDFALWINGFEVSSLVGSGITPSGLNKLSFSDLDTNDFYGKTKEIGYYDTILTDLELETLTSYKSWTSMVNELNLNIIYNG